MKNMMIVAVLVFAPLLAWAQTNKLETYKETFQRQEQSILAQYGKALDTLMENYKQKGNIEAYLIVEVERNRFETGKNVPLPNDAKDTFRATVESYHFSMADLFRKYSVALDGLITQLMRTNKIVEAKEAKSEKDRIVSLLADLETKLSKSHRSSGTKSILNIGQWKDVTGDLVGGKKTPSGIVLKGEKTQTKEPYAVPVEIEYVVKCDPYEVRLAYACDQLIFNWSWQGRLDELRIDGGPASTQYRPNKGRIPVGKFVTIRQVVTKTKMEIYVDGKFRTSWDADFSNWESTVGVMTVLEATVTVKSIRVKRLSELPNGEGAVVVSTNNVTR